MLEFWMLTNYGQKYVQTFSEIRNVSSNCALVAQGLVVNRVGRSMDHVMALVLSKLDKTSSLKKSKERHWKLLRF